MTARLAAAVSAQIAALALVLSSSPARAADTCGETPDAPALAGTAEQVFGRARAAFEAKQFTAAAPLFHAVAMAHPDTDVGRSAVSLSLESLNMAAKEKGPACFDVMAAEVPEYLKLYCAVKAKAEPSEPCGMLHKIARDIARLSIEKGVKKADEAKPSQAREHYREAGDRYLAVWNEHMKDACRSGKADVCARSEELLYNAARAYRAAGALPQAFAVSAQLLDPANRLAHTELARKAVYEDGGDWMRIAEFDRAASSFERFAAESPRSDRAQDALGDAIVLRIALGDAGRAEKNFEAMEKLFGARSPARIATVGVALASALGEQSQWKDVERILGARRSLLAKATPTVRLRAEALLGRALATQGKKAEAEAALKRVASTRLADLGPLRMDDDAASMREIGRTLSAIGEAKLYFADEKRDAALKRKVKKGDQASLEQKRRAVEDAEKAYSEILSIEPMPPPRTVVAALGSVARLHTQLWAQVYLAMGSAAAEPAERAATAANEKCVALGAKFQAGDNGSRACAKWLERHQRARFPPLHEIMPAPRYQADGLLARPLDEDGEPR